VTELLFLLLFRRRRLEGGFPSRGWKRHSCADCRESASHKSAIIMLLLLLLSGVNHNNNNKRVMTARKEILLERRKKKTKSVW
jgi:hypothetical protein